MTPQVAVVIPVLNRPKSVKPLIDSFVESCSREQAFLYLVAQEGDEEEIAEIRRSMRPSVGLIRVPANQRSWPKKVNAALLVTSEPWLLLGGDDMRFHKGWFEEVSPYFLWERVGSETGIGVVGTPIKGRPTNDVSSGHSFVSREYVKQYGTLDEKGKVVHEGYHHNFVDIELALTAWKRGMYQFARECNFEHLHPLNGTAKIDSTYRLGSLNYNEDEALFNERSKRFELQKDWRIT